MKDSAAQPVVRWRRADAPETGWKRIEVYPAANPGFTEAKAYELECSGEGLSLLVDDEPLQASTGSTALRWTWTPRFFAGEVTASLLRPDGVAAGLFLLDVSPEPGKLGREMFQQMIRELWEADPRLVLGTEPATVPTGALGDLEDPWLAFTRLRRYGPQFLRALGDVRARPRHRLRVERGASPLHRVRRVDRTTALSVLRSSAAALLLDAPDADRVLPRDARLDVPVVEETLDCAPNRTLMVMAQGVLRRAVDLRCRLAEIVNRAQESETRTSLPPRWPERRRFLQEFETEMRRALRGMPFPHVRRPEVTAAGLTAVAADPVYAGAWGRGWRALRHGVESDDSTERLWISPTWEIYERWCFLELGRQLSTVPGWTWDLKLRGERRLWAGRSGVATGELELQPTFPAYAGRTTGRWSVSRQRVPDMLLTVHDASGTRFTVFDAKYRRTREAVLDAMASAHIYQDSLRIDDRRPDASFLLVPAGGGAGWLEEHEFQAAHRVGVHVLTPGKAGGTPHSIQTLLPMSKN